MPTYTFKVHRTGELSVPCSVPWALEGVGSNPIPGSAFPGGVLPSGTASFAANAVLAEPSFDLLEGERPALDQTGRLILSSPVGCKIDPQADRHAITLVGDGPKPPPPDLYEPIKLADLPASRRTNVTTLGTRTGSAGENFVLGANISDATLTLGGDGKLGQEIVFRGDTDSSAATGLRTLTNCTINLSGDFCGLARLVLRNCRISVGNNSCFITRCEFTDFVATRNPDAMIIVAETGAKSSHFSCHKCDFTDRLGANEGHVFYKTQALDMVFAYNLLEKHAKHDVPESMFVVYVGESNTTTNIKTMIKIHHNLIVDCDFTDITEIKASDVDSYENTVERCGGAGFRIRHGMRNKVRRNIFLEAGNGPLITVRTGPHEITENRARTGSGAAGGGSIHLYAGNLHWDYEEWKKEHKPGAEKNWQASGHCTVVGNDMPVINGRESCGKNQCYHNYLATENNVGPNSGASRNRSVDNEYEKDTKTTAVAGYDIDRTLTRMTRGAVGLRAA